MTNKRCQKVESVVVTYQLICKRNEVMTRKEVPKTANKGKWFKAIYKEVGCLNLSQQHRGQSQNLDLKIELVRILWIIFPNNPTKLGVNLKRSNKDLFGVTATNTYMYSCFFFFLHILVSCLCGWVELVIEERGKNDISSWRAPIQCLGMNGAYSRIYPDS